MSKKKNTSQKQNVSKTETTEIKEEQQKLITKKDVIFILIITLIYSIVSFINLGSFSDPQTFWVTKGEGDSIILELEDDFKMANIRYYSGNNYGEYTIYFSNDPDNFSFPLSFTTDSVYSWKDYNIHGNFKYIKISGNAVGLYLGELGIYDDDGNLANLIPVNDNAKLLIDEQNTIPDELSYLYSTYFDEVYFPRTAYEHLNNMPACEWVHPPLGKLIIAIPIAIFGMVPFAYRIMGNIAGILMIPTMYIFAKMLFKKSKYGILASIIMAVDGMHFVQTRIGTVDSFLVLFILLSYLFMYKYIINKNSNLSKKLWALFWSGLFIGMAIAVKWTGLFGGLGLAIIFFLDLILELIKTKKWNKEHTIIILCCIVFFVIIPILIYLLSYIPFYTLENAYIKDLDSFITWQKAMYSYHHDLEATHPYSSEWYTWPVTGKSVLYWVGNTNDGKITRIALLGNPVIFWFSIPCMLYVLLSNRKFKYWFLIIAIASMFIPYIGITRIMFLYHYFPVLPFAMLSIVAFMEALCEKINSNIPIYIFLGLAIIAFIMFYPIYSGFPTTAEYIKNLQWLKTWIW